MILIGSDKIEHACQFVLFQYASDYGYVGTTHLECRRVCCAPMDDAPGPLQCPRS